MINETIKSETEKEVCEFSIKHKIKDTLTIAEIKDLSFRFEHMLYFIFKIDYKEVLKLDPHVQALANANVPYFKKFVENE